MYNDAVVQWTVLYNVILPDKVKIELYPLATVGEQVACGRNLEGLEHVY
jgi:hypothetical protein